MLTIGQTLQNRYTIQAVLGQGGMGAVYKVYDSRTRVVCVVKELVLQAATPQELVEAQQQFEQEAVTLAHLQHPNLPRVTDYFGEQGSYFLVMDLIEGKSLEEVIGTAGLPEAQVVRYAAQLLDAIAFCHSRRVLHRDIKPQNIIVQADGKAVLVDFGLVKISSTTNRTGMLTKSFLRGLGTPHYAPPEQYSGGTDTRSDLYALGATLYHALTGQLPASATDRSAGARLTTPRAFKPNVSPHVAQTILKAMALDMGQRFQSADAFKAALLTSKRVVRWELIGLALLLLGLLVAAWVLFGPGSPASPTAAPAVIQTTPPQASTLDVPMTSTSEPLPTVATVSIQPAAIAPVATSHPSSTKLPTATDTPNPIATFTATALPSPTDTLEPTPAPTSTPAPTLSSATSTPTLADTATPEPLPSTTPQPTTIPPTVAPLVTSTRAVATSTPAVSRAAALPLLTSTVQAASVTPQPVNTSTATAAPIVPTATSVPTFTSTPVPTSVPSPLPPSPTASPNTSPTADVLATRVAVLQATQTALSIRSMQAALDATETAVAILAAATPTPVPSATDIPTRMPRATPLPPRATATPVASSNSFVSRNEIASLRSRGNREIGLTTIGNADASSVIVVIGGIEGGEQPETTLLADAFIGELNKAGEASLQDVLFVVIPVLNPDGYANGTRFNDRRVDINRNWETDNWTSNAPVPGSPKGRPGAGGSVAFSEPETRAVRDHLLALKREHQRVTVIVFHSTVSSSPGVFAGYTSTGPDQPSSDLATQLSNAMDYDLRSEWSYDTPGELINWCADNEIVSADIVWRRGAMPSAQILYSLLKSLLT